MVDGLLFSSISHIQNTREFVAVCHSCYKSEARPVIDNLVLLCKEHFGGQATVLFCEEVHSNDAHRI